MDAEITYDSSGAVWAYDEAGRASTLTATSTGAAPQTFTYHWVAGRPQLIDNVVGPAHTAWNTYEPLRDVLATKMNRVSAGGALISGFTYSVNSLGQRTSVQHSGSAFTPAFNIYEYDGLGQVTSAKRFAGGTLEAPTSPVAGQQFGFAYDTIGNRKSATDGVTATAYTPNAVNQYAEINSTEPTYDIDGNLLTDGNLTCQWDGENRLVSATKADGSQIVSAYDALSRRVRKTVKQGTTVTSDTAYVYDGWNVIAEYNLTSGSPALAAVNTWGLDLSNSRQGAGGVGGLLARATSAATLAYTFDGNGNVSELVTAAGSVAGHYEYGPFGQTTAQTDSDATGTFAANPYRFSTKPLDAESGLYYYGYRHYNPVDGRWVNRDPIQERGGINLYGYVGNQPSDDVDPFGTMASLLNCPCKCKSVKWTFSPGGSAFDLGHIGKRFGDDINVEWTVDGNPQKCILDHNESGLAVINAKGKISPGQPDGASVVGINNTVPDSMKAFSSHKITYTDHLGWTWVNSSYNGLYTMTVNITATLKCTSEDGTTVSNSYVMSKQVDFVFNYWP